MSSQLVISSSSLQGVRGNAAFTPQRAFGGTGEIQVSVTFDATCTPPFTGPLSCQ